MSLPISFASTSRRSRVLLVLGVFAIAFFYLRPTKQGDSPFGWDRIGNAKTWPNERSTEHPIKLLHREALSRFEDLIARQSKTYEEAVEEYRRRYKREPPPGFDKWYEFAHFKNSVIIDDFDMILESLQPWEKLEPHVIVRLFERAAAGPALWTFGVNNGFVISDEDNWQGVAMRELLKPVAQDLPNFELLLNPLDEPRVLLTTRGDSEIIHWNDESKVSAWDRVEGPCRYRRAGQGPRLPPESAVDTQGIPFVTDRWNSLDICKNPEFEAQHGFLIAPFSFYVTNSPVPLLSQAKPSTFADILMPSMWYFNAHMEDLWKIDPSWAEKENALYWAGSTTGGAMRAMPSDDGVPILSQRLRFIRKTKQLGEQVYSFLIRQPKTGFWVKTTGEGLDKELYDTKFIAVVQCEGEVCDTAEAEYQVGERDEAEEAFKHRFLMDLDGNSFSGRFYNFLQSKSCPLKQTIFREWHDERLVPWVHFVPISVSLDDLPEAMRYLATTEEGGQVAQKIAEMGKEWHDKFLRSDDAAVYLFRLFLEFARLVDPDRKV